MANTDLLFTVDDVTLIDGVTLNGEPLRMAVSRFGQDYLYYGDGWCLRTDPRNFTTQAFLDYCESRYIDSQVATQALKEMSS